MLFSISVWHLIRMSKQIYPWNTLACCWDVKQPTNNIVMGSCCLEYLTLSGQGVVSLLSPELHWTAALWSCWLLSGFWPALTTLLSFIQIVFYHSAAWSNCVGVALNLSLLFSSSSTAPLVSMRSGVVVFAVEPSICQQDCQKWISVVSLLRVALKYFHCLTFASLATVLNTSCFSSICPQNFRSRCFASYFLPQFHHCQLVSPRCLGFLVPSGWLDDAFCRVFAMWVGLRPEFTTELRLN